MQSPASGTIRGPQRVMVDLTWWGRERQVPWQTARAPPKSLSLGASTCSLPDSLLSPL